MTTHADSEMAAALMTCHQCDKATGEVIARDGLSCKYSHWEYMQCTLCQLKWHICLHHLRAWPWENTGTALKHFMTMHPETKPAIAMSSLESRHFQPVPSRSESDISIGAFVDDDNGSEVNSNASSDSIDMPLDDMEPMSLPASNEWESLASQSPWQSTPLSFHPCISTEICNQNTSQPLAKRPCSNNDVTFHDLLPNSKMPPQSCSFFLREAQSHKHGINCLVGSAC